MVNWFLKDEEGKFLWPGFGENFRVLWWILERCEKKVEAIQTAVGFLPRLDEFPWEGLSLSSASLEKLFFIEERKWLQEYREAEEFFQKERAVPTVFYERIEQIKQALRVRIGSEKRVF